MAVTLTGTTGNDTLFGSTAQAAEIKGLAGDDRLISQYTNTTLLGNAGDDLLEIQAGDGSVVTINPGQGNDTVSISGLTTLGTLYIANGLGTSVNFGDDLFNFDTAAAAPFLQGTIRGGEGNDTLIMADGIDGNNFKYNAGQGVDQISVSANSAVNMRNAEFRAGQGNDSATFAFNSAFTMNAMTVAGGKGDDTINFSTLSAITVSGANAFLAGDGADIVSATMQSTAGLISGSLDFIGGAGLDTISLIVSGATTGKFDLSIYGDDSGVAGTGTDADTITLTFAGTTGMADTTGMIAGGGGNDTIVISANITAGSAGFSVNGGLGNDSITITDGGNYAGTINGADGADKIVVNMGSGWSAASVVSGAGFATLLGGAGNDTFTNTSVGTSVNTTAYGTTGLVVAIQDFVTGDLVELLGQKVVNENSNLQRSAFVTRTFSTNSGVGITAAAANNIAMYRDGDDVVLQVMHGTGSSAALTAGSDIGIAVIRFVDNSGLATQIDAASGALSNVDMTFTQGLAGFTIQLS